MEMRGSDINLRHLRAFNAVCDFGGISAAANTVHLSQPAITQAISKLERDFNVRLFRRSNKGMFPTEAAEILLHRVRRAFAQLADGAAYSSRKDHIDSGYLNAVTSTQLRALIAVATHGNYSVAARAVGVSQPSLHRAARDLEALADVPLYVKSAQGISLTSAAEILVRGAKLAFAELDQATEELSEIKGAKAGLLRIGSLPLSLGTILPEAVNRITTARPNLKVSVVDAPFAELLYGLRNGDLDLTLGALRTPTPAPDVIQEPLFDDRLCIVCAPDHPLHASSQISKDRLSGFPWVVARGKTPTRAHFDHFFQGLAPAVTGPTIESNSMILVRRVLEGSNKLAMISLTQATEHLRARTLLRLPIDLGDTPRTIGITYRQDWKPTNAQKAFMDVIRNVAKTLHDCS